MGMKSSICQDLLHNTPGPLVTPPVLLPDDINGETGLDCSPLFSSPVICHSTSSSVYGTALYRRFMVKKGSPKIYSGFDTGHVSGPDTGFNPPSCSSPPVIVTEHQDINRVPVFVVAGFKDLPLISSGDF